MTGVDTNVLVRYLTEDDEGQTDRVHRFLKKSRVAGEPVFVSTLVLVESCWVLRSAHRKSRLEILGAVERLVNADLFQVEEADAVRKAMHLAQRGKADFTDHLIGEIHLARGCRFTATFDRALKSSSAFSLL